MSNDKGTKDRVKHINQAVVVDQNNDFYDPDNNHNTGGHQVVVMQGGKPVIAGTKTQEVEKDVDTVLADNRTVRTTALPDMLESGAEEIVVSNVISNKGPLEKGKPKKISRIPTEAAPASEKKKRGRPKKV